MEPLSCISRNKGLTSSSVSQEKEYKEALEAFNEKNKEKVQLISRLMEVSNVILWPIICVLFNLCLNGSLSGLFVFLCRIGFILLQLVGESEKLRMKKLEELSKSIETIR